MTSNADNQEMLKRLQELEEENARLRSAAKSDAGKELIVSEGEYKGHPTLTFEGPFRSFTLGLKKLSVIKSAWPQVDSFLQRHNKVKLSDYDDDKI